MKRQSWLTGMHLWSLLCGLGTAALAAAENGRSETEIPSAGAPVAKGYRQLDRCERALLELDNVSFASLGRAVRDLMAAFPDRYKRGEQFLAQAERLAPRLAGVRAWCWPVRGARLPPAGCGPRTRPDANCRREWKFQVAYTDFQSAVTRISSPLCR
jgi:hypothetical protein